MAPCGGGGDPPARCAREESKAYEKRLGELLDRLAFLPDGNGQGCHTDGPPAEAAAQRAEHGTVEAIEAELVDLVERQRVMGDDLVDDSPGAHLGEVTDPAQQPVGDARGAA